MADSTQSALFRPNVPPVFTGICISIKSVGFCHGLLSCGRPPLGNSLPDFVTQRIQHKPSTPYSFNSHRHVKVAQVFSRGRPFLKDSSLNFATAVNFFVPSWWIFSICHLPIFVDMSTLLKALLIMAFALLQHCISCLNNNSGSNNYNWIDWSIKQKFHKHLCKIRTHM